MKLLRLLMSVVLSSIAMVTAYAWQSKDLAKEAKKEAKSLKREGWKVPAGSLSMERQLTEAYQLQAVVDADRQPKYIFGQAISGGGFYDAAKMQALELAKVELAGNIATELTSAIALQLENQQISQNDFESMARAIEQEKSKVTKTLTSVIPVVEIYREKKGGGVEVQIRLAYSRKRVMTPFITACRHIDSPVKKISNDSISNSGHNEKKDRRIAFVIGNSDYQNPKAALENPHNDAKDISSKLETLGFDVLLAVDVDRRSFDQCLYEFGEKSRDYDVALFYYAGHGIQSQGINYLIPVDAELKTEDDVKYACINANQVLDKMESSHCKAKIVILDACRNNPFERSWHRGIVGRGLSVMTAPQGIFIAYATSPGSVAQDGEGRNSPYTSAMLKMLDEPNLPIEFFFKNILREVKEKTNGKQTPWTANSFEGDFYFNKQ